MFPPVDMPAEHEMLRETAKKPRVQTLHTSVSILNINVCESRFRKRLNMCDSFGTPLFSKKNMAAQFKFANMHLNKPQEHKKNVLLTNKSKLVLFDQNAQHHIQSLSAGILQTICQAWWWRAEDLGLFSSHWTWALLHIKVL